MLVAYEVWTKILVSLQPMYTYIFVFYAICLFFSQCTVILQKKIHEKYKKLLLTGQPGRCASPTFRAFLPH